MRKKILLLSQTTWFKTIIFSLAYFCTAIFSNTLSFQGGSTPTLWLPSGLLVAILLLNPIKQWSIFLAGALPAGLAYSLFAHQPFFNSTLLTLFTLLEAVTGAWLIQRFDPDPGTFKTTRNVFNLIFFSVLSSAALNAAIVTTILATVTPGMSYWATWMLNWFSHMLGIIVAAPLILSWSYVPSKIHLPGPDKWIELTILLIGLVVCSLYISIGKYAMSDQNYLVIPFLVWAALRFGPRGTTIAGFIFSIVAIWGSVYHIDGFAINDVTIAPSIQSLSTFLIISLSTCYIIAALLEQNNSAQTALQTSDNRYKLLVENQGEGMAIIDLQENFKFANPAANQIFGLTDGGLVGRNFREFAQPDQFEIIQRQKSLCEKNRKTTYEVGIVQAGGALRTIRLAATAQFSSAGQFDGIFAVFHDITDQKIVERTLRESRSRYQNLFDNSPIPIWEEDFSRIKRLVEEYRRTGVEDLREFLNANPKQLDACQASIRILDVNMAAMQVFGFADKAEFLAQMPKMIARGPFDVFTEEIIAIGEGKTSFSMEGPNDLIDDIVRYHSVHWTVAPGHEQDYKRVIVSIMDVTERKQAEDNLRYLSTHDVLTGLYNRNFFEAELERLQDSRMEPTNLMIVDVNGMKAANDTYGHPTGDDLLRRTAQVLRLSFRKEDIIARIGGDEFAILFHGAISLEETVRRVHKCLSEHNQWHTGPMLSLAIGTASGGKDSSLTTLFKKADQLMYKEKASSRGERSDGRPSSEAVESSGNDL